MSFDFIQFVPGEGMCDHANFYKYPDADSEILNKNNSSHLYIKKREKGWALCDATGGIQDVWIKESDMKYPIVLEISEQFENIRE